MEPGKEKVLYDVPTSTVKATESSTQKKLLIEMKENLSYKVPSQMIKMTGCQAYGSLPNRR